MNSSVLLIPICVPFVAAVLVMLLRSRPSVRDCVPVAGAVLTFGSVLSLVPHVMQGGTCAGTLFTLYPGITVAFSLDGLGLLFAGTASGLWVLASLYCIGYMRSLDEHAQTRFYVCYAVAVGSALGAACSANFFTLYLFYEIITIFTYPLVAHHQDAAGYSGARKYLVYLMFASKACLLPAMALIYVQCGTLDFAVSDIHKGIFPAGGSRVLVSVTYALCLLGFAKAAIMPLHSWLPAAMVAPTPVSALLHAVVVVKVGVFSICRVMLSVFGTELLVQYGLGLITAYVAGCTIIVASVIAMTKTDLKARLAYSTVSQLSYIVLGVALLAPNGLVGGLIHIPNHAFAKITLFFCAGAILAATGKKDIRDMGGLGYCMPVTMAAFGLASLSMIGVPPVSGFVTKWYLALGTLDRSSVVLLCVVLFSSLLNAVYFGEVFVRAFFGTPSGDAVPKRLERKPLMLLMVVPLLVTAVLSVVWGLYPDFFMNIIRLQVGS